MIVDEIHALVRDKRGAHLALSLERLEALCRPAAAARSDCRATQKPLDRGRRVPGRRRTRVRPGGRGHVPRTWTSRSRSRRRPWRRCARTSSGRRSTTRLAELVRGAPHHARLREHAQDGGAHLGPAHASCWARTRSRATTAACRSERRLDAEQRLKAGTLRALVATASLELGIDIGEVDLVIQVGATRSVATLLQRVGRSGHALSRLPKGRIFPLTLDELVEAAALLRCVRDVAARPHRGSAAAPRHPGAAAGGGVRGGTAGRDRAVRADPSGPGRIATWSGPSSTRSCACTRRTAGARCSTATASASSCTRPSARA